MSSWSSAPRARTCWRSEALRARVHYASAAPGGLRSGVGAPAVFDMDDYRRRDLVVCEHLQVRARRRARRGDVGDVQPRRRALGRASRPSTGPTGDGAAAVGDVTGDGRPELLLAHVGNPLRGRVRVADATVRAERRAWKRRGSFPVRTAPTPSRSRTSTATPSPTPWSRTAGTADDPTRRALGSRAGLRAVDPALAAPEPDPLAATGRFDDDETPDTATVERNRTLVLRRSAPGGQGGCGRCRGHASGPAHRARRRRDGRRHGRGGRGVPSRRASSPTARRGGGPPDDPTCCGSRPTGSGRTGWRRASARGRPCGASTSAPAERPPPAPRARVPRGGPATPGASAERGKRGDAPMVRRGDGGDGRARV